MEIKNKKLQQNHISSAKVIDFRLWQRKKLQNLIKHRQLTDCLIFAERLGYSGEWGIEFIRHLQNQEVV